MKTGRHLLAVLGIFVLAGCASSKEIKEFGGNTMGTTYQVTYVSTGDSMEQKAQAVEVLLADINQSLSTYIDGSLISRINTTSDITAWHPIDAHFDVVFRRAREIYRDTGGAFNPAVAPLVNAWGFGPKGRQPLPDDEKIKALLKLTPFEVFDFRDSPPAVRKQVAGAELDFGAIAQGYAADAIAALLEGARVTNYLVELGGEVRARGQHPEGRGWRIGIGKPAEDVETANKIQAVLSLTDAGLATSGNYRNYRVVDGKKITHILNPKTGYPEPNSLLSVSVIAPDAMTADAYATAFIVMGLDESLRFIENHKQLHAYFIARDQAGEIIEKSSPGFPMLLRE